MSNHVTSGTLPTSTGSTACQISLHGEAQQIDLPHLKIFLPDPNIIFGPVFGGQVNTSQAVYLDTCVISGYVNEDMKSSDNDAFQQIINMSQRNELPLCSSTIFF